MFGLHHRTRLWALWMIAAAALLMANPLSDFGWVELAAVVGPVAMVVDRRIWREAALAIGVPILTLLWLAEADSPAVARLLVAWATYGVGVALAARAIDAQSELEAVAGQVAYGVSPPEGFARFELALDRELARARRHERPFVLLSAAPETRTLAAALVPGPETAKPSALVRSVLESRARFELRDWLDDELHLYSDVVVYGDRVLALVPEVGGDDAAALLERLRGAAPGRLAFEVAIGVARFPADAVCADELIAAADRDRMASKLTPLPERRLEAMPSEAAALAPDGKG